MQTSAMTENEIRIEIAALEVSGRKGDLTPATATRLTELKIALRSIICAKRLH